MGVVGCILGFLVVIYLCYKDWSVYIASIVGAAVVIAFNVLPFMDTLLDSYENQERSPPEGRSPLKLNMRQ